MQEDCQAHKLNKEDAMDHSRWRKMIKDGRGVARIFCLGGQTMSGGARPCEHRSCEAHAGGLGPPPEEFC